MAWAASPSSIALYHGMLPGYTLIAYDDFALPLGRIRLRLKGSAGGHNGMQSALDHLGTDEVPRLRIGIDRPPGRMAAADYVLQSFTNKELQAVSETLDRAADAALTFATEGLNAAMNKFNGGGVEKP